MATTELATARALPGGQGLDGARSVTRFDFRRGELFGREAVRALEAAHELFTRRVASALGSVLRGLVRLDLIGVDQVSFDAYVRSMPNPNVLSVLTAPPLPGTVLLELNPQLALAMVDRMLGGRTPPGAGLEEGRRPTDLETVLLTDLSQHLAGALGETLAVVPGCRPALDGLEYNPQLVQAAVPSDTVLVLSYRLEVAQGMEVEGLLTVCYPSATVVALLEHLRQRAGGAGEARPARNPAVVEQLAGVEVSLTVALAETAVSARDLAVMAVGDVLRLDHRVGEPVLGLVAGTPVMDGHLGRRGRRLAFQVARRLVPDPAPADIPEPDRSSA